MPKLEKTVEKYFVDKVTETRGIHRKMAWPGRRGAPDHWAGWPHLKLYLIVEIKEPDQDWGMQEHQQREIDRLKACGMNVCIAHGKEGIDAIFRVYGIRA